MLAGSWSCSLCIWIINWTRRRTNWICVNTLFWWSHAFEMVCWHIHFFQHNTKKRLSYLTTWWHQLSLVSAGFHKSLFWAPSKVAIYYFWLLFKLISFRALGHKERCRDVIGASSKWEITLHLINLDVFLKHSYYFRFLGHSRTCFRWQTHDTSHTKLARPGWVLWGRSLVQDVKFARSSDDSVKNHCIRFARARLVHGKNHRKIFWVIWLQVNAKSLRTSVYFPLFLKCSVLRRFRNPLGKVGFWSINLHKPSLVCNGYEKEQVKQRRPEFTHFYLIKYFLKITIKPRAASVWTVDARQNGSMLSCCLCQILSTPLKCRSRNSDSPDQATFSQSSIDQFLANANLSLNFLFLADGSGTWCGLLQL